MIISQIRSYLKNRPEYVLGRKKFIHENNIILWAGAALYIVCLLIRSWEHFTHPGFYVEDATYYFKLNYDSTFSFANILRNPNGYYNLFNNFIAQIISYLDIRLQPAAYLAVATSLSVSTIILFTRTGLIKNKYLLLVMPLVLGLSGLNHIHYYTTVTFQMYLLVITLLLVLLWEKQASPVKNLLIFILIPILVWSGPYSVLMVPFAMLFMLLFRGKDLIMIWTILVTLAYVLSTTGSTGSTIQFQHLFSEFYQGLWFDTLIRDVFFMGLREHPNLEKLLLLSAILGFSLFFIRKDTFTLRILVLLIVLIISTPAPLLLSKKYFLYRDVYPCHILTAHIAWILFVLLLLDRLIPRVPDKIRSVTQICLMAAIFTFVVVDNIKHPRKGAHEILYNTSLFTQRIKDFEQSDLKENNENVTITADGIGIFDPEAIVGSRKPGAETIRRIYIPQITREESRNNAEEKGPES